MTTSERFWSKVDLFFGITDEDCWLWQGATDECGYGRFSIEGKNRKAHSVVWFLVKGFWPDYLCHKCDTPNCVNPNHLFIGNHSINMIDCYRKGRRIYKGDNNPRSILTQNQVNEIRNATGGWGLNVSLARKYGISRAQISAIRNNKAWI